MIAPIQPGDDQNDLPIVDSVRADGASDAVGQVEASEEGESEAGRRAGQQEAVRISIGREGAEASSKDFQQFNAKGALVPTSDVNRPSTSSIGAGASDTQTDDDSGKEAEEQAAKAEEAELKKIDRETRRHEQAHKAALGSHAAGGIQYQFTTGPRGGQFAVGGSVPVDLSEEDEGTATVQKAQTIKRAALAPAEPSSADRSVAAQASQLEAQGRGRVEEEKQAKESGEAGDKAPPPDIFSQIAAFQNGESDDSGGGQRLSIRV
jgi:hypothetical protein